MIRVLLHSMFIVVIKDKLVLLNGSFVKQSPVMSK